MASEEVDRSIALPCFTSFRRAVMSTSCMLNAQDESLIGFRPMLADGVCVCVSLRSLASWLTFPRNERDAAK